LAAQATAPDTAFRVEMRMLVEPGEHYVRMFRAMLQRNPNMDATTQTLLREALSETEAASFRLDDVVVTGPTGPGESGRTIAK
jgi:hypothetical protein